MNLKKELNQEKEQTATSFSDKWINNKKLIFKDTLDENSQIHKWILSRNGWKDKEQLSKHLKTKKRILDAGCGNGRVTALLQILAPLNSKIVGIDLTSVEVARNNLKDLENIDIYKKDLLEDLSDLGKFDYIYCQEVLHHTENPLQAFLNLCNLLEENGEIGIYVYKKKAPVREFTDENIREKLSKLPYEESIKVCEQITTLGESLSKLDTKINVPDIPILEITAGEYDIQRFFYHFFMKCFYNPNLTFQECNAINYDWYHPQICYKYTKDEIEKWFNQAGLKIIHSHVDHYGITMQGKR